MTMTSLPNNILTLRTGTASDGRMLSSVRTSDPVSSLRDIRERLPNDSLFDTRHRTSLPCSNSGN